MRIVVLAASNARDGFRMHAAVAHLAGLGWDITVVGTTRNSQRTEGKLGLAKTVLLPIGPPESHRTRLISTPFAYDSRDTAVSRGRQADDLRARVRESEDLSVIARQVRRGWAAGATRLHSIRKNQTLARLGGQEEARIANIRRVLALETVRLSPDLIHAVGAANLPAAALAAQELRASGGSPVLVYEAKRLLSNAAHGGTAALLSAEARHIRDAQVVVAGNSDWAERIATDYQLSTTPITLVPADRLRSGKGLNRVYELHLGELAPLLGRNRLRKSPKLSRITADELLERANCAMAEDDIEGAVHYQDRAAGVLFDRGMNLGGESSPIAKSPESFLSAWNESAVIQRVSGASEACAPGPRLPAANRALVVTDSNENFLDSLATPLATVFGSVDSLVLSPASPPLSTHMLLASRQSDSLADEPWTRDLSQKLSKYDTVVVDWCDQGAVITSMLAPPTCRLVIRLHSFEAFTIYPHLVNWSRVDDLVFVGEHLRRLVTSAVPALRDVRSHTIPIPTQVKSFRQPKRGDARVTMGLVGWASPAKDVPWALEVLSKVRQCDPEFRMQLIGDPPDPVRWPEYAEKVSKSLMNSHDSVSLVPKTDDVPIALRSIGFILSTSVRESLHLGLAEGAASAAIPVVRDWPALRTQGGAQAVYPLDWIVQTPDQAAERILRFRDDVNRLPAGDAASDWIQEHMGPERTIKQWRVLLSRVK